MDKQTGDSLKTLSEIRDLMQKSTRFISLSGLSGISAGIFALIGAALAYWRMGQHWQQSTGYTSAAPTQDSSFVQFCIINALVILVLSLAASVFFSVRKSKKTGQKIWDKTVWQLLLSLGIPLATGGVFCVALLVHHLYSLIAPTMLIFYGMALLNASKYTFKDIVYLAYLEIILGLLNAFYGSLGLFFWAVGFGVLHILYGWYMYVKYDK